MIFTVIHYLAIDRRKISPLVVCLNTNCKNVYETWRTWEKPLFAQKTGKPGKLHFLG